MISYTGYSLDARTVILLLRPMEPPLLDKQINALKDYARADYARDILRANKRKPLEERWRLVLNSEEHRQRQLFARTRAKYLVLSLLPLLVLAAILGLTVGLDAEVHLTIASYDVGDAVAIFACVVYVAAAFVFAWRVGSKAAQRQWMAQSNQKTVAVR